MNEFRDEVAVLSRWLGRDIAADLLGVVPIWNAFRFRDAAVFELDVSTGAPPMYLVRGEAVSEFFRSQVSIDEAYAELIGTGTLTAA